MMTGLPEEMPTFTLTVSTHPQQAVVESGVLIMMVALSLNAERSIVRSDQDEAKARFLGIFERVRGNRPPESPVDIAQSKRMLAGLAREILTIIREGE